MEKKKKQMKKQCKEFELDLTDYVMGETTFLTTEKQEKLFEHLRQCAKCRDQLWNWKEVIAVMKTRSAMEKPEHQQKINKLIERLHQESARLPITMPGVPVNLKQEVKQTAREVFDLLGQNRVMSIPEIIEETKRREYTVQQAIGWLGVTDKIIVSRDTKTAYISRLPETRIQL